MSAPPRPTRRRLKVVCPHDCPDTCVMTVDVEDGRAVAIGGDPDHRFTQGFLCAKVNRYLERVYSPERLLHPMRRVGTKGEGRFERISWDEALDTVAERFRGDRRASTAPQAILPYSYAGQHGPARLREHGPALLPRARGEPARPDDLLVGRGRTATRPRSGRRWASTPRRSSTRG